VPYVSDKQRRYFNANRDEIGPKVVDEFNQASKGKKLPERAPKKKTMGQRLMGNRKASN